VSLRSLLILSVELMAIFHIKKSVSKLFYGHLIIITYPRLGLAAEGTINQLYFYAWYKTFRSSKNARIGKMTTRSTSQPKPKGVSSFSFTLDSSLKGPDAIGS